MVETPTCSSAVRAAGSLKRATPITRFFTPAALWRTASCAMETPIFPATPSNMMSPASSRIKAMIASPGRDINSSSSPSEAIIFGYDIRLLMGFEIQDSGFRI